MQELSIKEQLNSVQISALFLNTNLKTNHIVLMNVQRNTLQAKIIKNALKRRNVQEKMKS